MLDTGMFTLGGKSSKDFGIVITTPPPIVFAEREFESLRIPGKSGDITIDAGRYKNVTIPYECAFVPKNGQNLRDLATESQVLLMPTSGYRRLEDSFKIDRYRMARVIGQLSVESIVEKAGVFTVNFDSDPRAFLKSGETEISFSRSGSISNPTIFDALPLIKVTGSAAGTVSVNGTTVEIKSISGTIYLDCENENAYSLSAGAPKNENANIYAPDFPVLSPGDNSVQFTGGITSVKITPRWWEL